MGPSGPDDHGPYSVSCSRTAGWTASAVAALGREFIAETAKAWSSSPLAGVSTSIAQGRGHGAGVGAQVRGALSDYRRRSKRDNFLKPLPGETVAARTRHHSHPCSAGVRGGDHQLPQYLWGRRRPPWYAPLHHWVNRGSIGARLPCVFARRARRANRAQSTAQH